MEGYRAVYTRHKVKESARNISEASTDEKERQQGDVQGLCLATNMGTPLSEHGRTRDKEPW